MINTFTGWIEGFPTWTEKAEEVIKKNCSMKSFRDLVCPGHYKVTMGHYLLLRSPKGSLKALGITYYLHCPWRTQSSGKVERANQYLKSAIKKITQETSRRWKEALPIALLCTHIAPKEQAGLSPYEMLYGRPFVYVSDLFLDPEVQILQSYTMATGPFQQDISLWGMNQDPKDSKDSPLYAPGTQVLIKVWEDGSPKA